MDSLDEYKMGVIPGISAVVPTLNEQACILDLLQSLSLALDRISLPWEIIVCDGSSSDGTVNIVECLKHPNIKVITNAGNCPNALNLGIQSSKYSYIAKIDAHGLVDKDYFCSAVMFLEDNPRIALVGGPIVPIAKTPIMKASVSARSSFVGVGGGPNCYPLKNIFTDSVQCGVYRKSFLARSGIFDNHLQFGEDEELNYRLSQIGLILSSPSLRFYYYPRKTLKGLFLQYFRYGRARRRVLMTYPTFFNIKHVIPSLLVLYLVLLLLAGLMGCILPAALPLILYIFVVGLESVRLALVGPPYIHLIFISILLLHLGYGLGFLSPVSKSPQ